MGTLLEINDHSWTKLPATGSNAVLSTTAKRAVAHSEGANGFPVVLAQISADPAHPFTAGQFIFKHGTRGDRQVHFSVEGDEAPQWYPTISATRPVGSHEQGGLYLSNYRLPLAYQIELYRQASPEKWFLQINARRHDHAEIDTDDQTAATITIDPNTDETVTDIVLSNGTSSPSVQGGVEMRWELTEAQYDMLVPSQGGVVTRNKIGLTIASTSAVAPITYSAFSETHPAINKGEVYLKLFQTVGVQAPASGAWYARATNPDGSSIYIGD